MTKSRLALLIVTAWTIVGLVTTQFGHIAVVRAGGSASWTGMLQANLLNVWLWAAFTPAILWLGTRFLLVDARWPRHAGIHLAAAVLFAIADVFLDRALAALLALPGRRVDLVGLFFHRLFLNVLCYAALVGIATVIHQARVGRERLDMATRLAAQLAETRLQALQAQLRPHFLFNTLSMIAEQLHHDPQGADRMIGRLSALLRASLTAGSQEIPFVDELATLQAYLDIMEVRLAGRVRVHLDIDDDVHGAAVPALLLQPLVENAFRHGLERRRRDGVLSVTARRSTDRMTIAVADNGVGVDPTQMHEGVGLRVVRERLTGLHGGAATLRLERARSGGTIATVELPYRTVAGWSAAPSDIARNARVDRCAS